MNAPLNRRRISLQGGLALGRLLKEFSWFGQSSKTDDDPHQLGWRLNDPGAWPLISARRLTSLSAEAAAAFGAMHGAFGTTEPILERSTPATACERILCGLRTDSGPWESLPTGGSALLLREVDVTVAEEVVKVTDALVSDILAVPGSVREHLPMLREVLRRLITEALLNVHEHAYGQGKQARAWISVVCLPVLATRALYHAELTLAPEERRFLKSLAGKQLLEVAIADAGLGIPRTLAPAAGALLPELIERVRGVSSGQKLYELTRAAMHAGLCYYGFDHKSTSKDNVTKKFKTPEHELNWRGLYRCYRQIAELGGSISVTSGRGHAGYLPTVDGVEPFHIPLTSRSDLPGTVLTVRLPLPVRPRPAAPVVHVAGGTPVKIQDEVIRWDTLISEKPRPSSSLLKNPQTFR